MSVLNKDGRGRIRLIAPGRGSSGYYSPEVLKKSASKFTDAFTFWNHMSPAQEAERPEGDLRDLAGKIIGTPTYEEHGALGPGLYADVQVFEQFRPVVEEIGKHIGVSIRALGQTSAGKIGGVSMPVVEDIVAAKSVDWVVAPGAGGRIVEMFEAARGAAPIVDAPSTGAVVAPLERSARMDDLQEAKGLSAEDAKALREAFAGQAREIDEQKHRIKQLEEMVLMRQVADFVTAELASYTMPDMTRTRLAEQLAERPKLKESGEIDVDSFRSHIKEKVTGELRYLAEATGLGSGRIVGLGASSLQEADDARAYESLAKSLAKMSGSPEAAKIAARGRG